MDSGIRYEEIEVVEALVVDGYGVVALGKTMVLFVGCVVTRRAEKNAEETTGYSKQYYICSSAPRVACLNNK
jgi:hypothetical protein